MLVLRFLRFLLGYVIFNASGGFPERFINLCNKNKITLWNLKSSGDTLTACTDCSGYKKIRQAAKKSGMKVRIKRKHGLPFFLESHSARAAVMPGLCICIAVICILSSRIWSIEVTGNYDVSENEIISVFEQLGVSKGVKSKGIDITATEIAALQKLPEISWLNINIEGSAAVIEVRERNKVDIESNDAPADIVAARDGQIIILRTFNGTQEQKIGNAVLKGDLIISGIEENKDLSVNFCRAKGYVVARTNRKINFKQKNKLNVIKKDLKNKTYIIEFFGLKLPLGRTDGNSYKEKTELRINGVTLPAGITECTESNVYETQITLSENKAKALAAVYFFEECTKEFRYLKTQETEITAEADKNFFEFKGEFICLENIGEESAMDIVDTE